MATKLYVGNLSFRTTSEELREAFASVGTVESASVIEDRETGRSRGFACGDGNPRRRQRQQSRHLTARTLAAEI